MLNAAKAMAAKRLHYWLYESWCAGGNSNFLLSIPMQPPMVLTADPKDVEYCLKTNFANYPKGKFSNDVAGDLLGDGIFNADGESWHAQRKTASKMFTANRFKNHIWKVVEKNAATLVNLLRDAIGKEPIDLFDLMNRFTLDSIGEIGFGSDIQSLTRPDSPFLESFDKAQAMIPPRVMDPFWKIHRFFQTGHQAGSKKHLHRLRTLCTEIVDKLKADPGDSFVGLFISNALESGETFDDKFMQDLILNFLIAGRDTTAQALAWSIFSITQNPEVERKLMAEIDKVCGQEPLAYDHLPKLEYTQAVVYEGLRLFPSVPQTGRQCQADDTWPSGTFVPGGSQIWVSSFCMGRNKEVWGEDAAQYRPERWAEMATFPDSYHFPAFHAGPRECLGKRLATVEMKVAMVNLFRHFKYRLAVPPEQISPDVTVTIGMHPGLPCYVAER